MLQDPALVIHPPMLYIGYVGFSVPFAFAVSVLAGRLAYFLGIRNGPGEGHDQYVDDMYTTPDGSAVVVSRPSFADVVAFALYTQDRGVLKRFDDLSERAEYLDEKGRQIRQRRDRRGVPELAHDVEGAAAAGVVL